MAKFVCVQGISDALDRIEQHGVAAIQICMLADIKPSDMMKALNTGHMPTQMRDKLVQTLVLHWPDRVRQTIWLRTETRRIARGDAPAPASQAKKRKCICCSTRFTSEHFGHRMCEGCRRKTEGAVWGVA